jgi:hypothetical protein
LISPLTLQVYRIAIHFVEHRRPDVRKHQREKIEGLLAATSRRHSLEDLVDGRSSFCSLPLLLAN